jgi:uncharacterized protein (DUF58 family)
MKLSSIFYPAKRRLQSNFISPQNSIPLSASCLHQLDHLRLSASRFLPGRMVGQRPSLRRKAAVEFIEHRKYVIGDDIRFIDWKASARQENIFVRQGEQPKDVLVYILLDCSASMAWGDPPKSHLALQLAAALSYVTLSQGDRLALLCSSQTPLKLWGPVSGKGQFTNLVHYLNALVFTGQTDSRALFQSLRRLSVGNGLVILISDLLGENDLSEALAILPSPTWDVVILQSLHPMEVTPPLYGYVELQDCETSEFASYDVNAKAVSSYQKKLEAWFNQLDFACTQNHAFYHRVITDENLEMKILPDFRRLGILQKR